MARRSADGLDLLVGVVEVGSGRLDDHGDAQPVQAVGEFARTFARGEHEIGPVLRDGFDVRLEAGKLSHRRLGRKV